MTDAAVLLVEDDAAGRAMTRFALEQARFRVWEAADVNSACERVAEQPPSLILLDWNLPGMSGLAFLRQLKGDPATRQIPVMLLTARDHEEDKLEAFESGTDDYLTKPFSTRELLARIRALLRWAENGEAITADGLCIDPRSYRVTAGGRAVKLSPIEFRLLQLFMTHPERVFTPAQLAEQVWGRQSSYSAVTVGVLRLRRALAPSGHDRLIQSVHGVGYRFSVRD
jgi:two-component system phosphate regulon response regulator PhoB